MTFWRRHMSMHVVFYLLIFVSQRETRMTYKLEYEINFGLQLIVMLYSLFSNSFLYEICHDIAAIFGDIEHKHKHITDEIFTNEVHSNTLHGDIVKCTSFYIFCIRVDETV